MEVNVSSMVMMSKYAIPEMKKNEGQWRGSIVNMASVAGIRGGNPHLLYPTSKGAVVVCCTFPDIRTIPLMMHFRT
jgi:NAD(P)-dependent dehydrogenase (short-subunit alcohol dehydrogenase family)